MSTLLPTDRVLAKTVTEAMLMGFVFLTGCPKKAASMAQMMFAMASKGNSSVLSGVSTLLTEVNEEISAEIAGTAVSVEGYAEGVEGEDPANPGPEPDASGTARHPNWD